MASGSQSHEVIVKMSAGLPMVTRSFDGAMRLFLRRISCTWLLAGGLSFSPHGFSPQDLSIRQLEDPQDLAAEFPPEQVILENKTKITMSFIIYVKSHTLLLLQYSSDYANQLYSVREGTIQ